MKTAYNRKWKLIVVKERCLKAFSAARWKHQSLCYQQVFETSILSAY